MTFTQCNRNLIISGSTSGQPSHQPRSQGLSSLPPLVVGTETLVAAGHVTTQNLGGKKTCWKGGATGFSSRSNVLEYPPTLRFWMDR